MLTINNPNFSEMLEEEFGAGVHIEPPLPWYGDQFADTFLKSKLWKTMFNLGFWYKPNLGVDSRIIRVGFVTSNQPECTIRNNVIDILRILSAQMHDCKILLIPYSKEIQFLFSTDSKVDIDIDRIVENAISTLTPQQQEYYRKVLGYPQQLKVPVHKEIPCEANGWMVVTAKDVDTDPPKALTQSKVLAHLERHGWSYSDSSTILLDRTRPFNMPDKNFDIVQVLQFLTMEERDGRWGVAYDRTTGFFVFNFRETALSDVDSEVEKRIGSQHVHNHQTFREVLGLTEPQEEIAPTRPPVERLMTEDEFCKLRVQDGAFFTGINAPMDVSVMLELANQYALTLDAIDAIPDGQPDREKDVQTLVGLLENMEKAVPTGVPDCSKEVIQFIQKVGSYIKFSNTVKVEHRLGRIVSVAYALGMPFVKVEFVRTAIEQYRGEPVQVKYVPIWNNFNGATETVEIL